MELFWWFLALEFCQKLNSSQRYWRSKFASKCGSFASFSGSSLTQIEIPRVSHIICKTLTTIPTITYDTFGALGLNRVKLLAFCQLTNIKNSEKIIEVNNTYWQIYSHGSISTYYLYAAYYDKRPEKPTVRITAFIEQKKPKEWSISCGSPTMYRVSQKKVGFRKFNSHKFLVSLRYLGGQNRFLSGEVQSRVTQQCTWGWSGQ